MIYRCPHCSAEFQTETKGMVHCPACQESVKVAGLGGTAVDAERAGHWGAAFIAVVKSSIVDPVGHFQNVATGSGWLRPWLFALAISTVVFLIAAAYQLGFQLLAASVEFASKLTNPFALISVPFSAFFVVLFAVVGVPVGTSIGLLVQAGVYHVCLLLLGASRRPFVDTFRVVCYAMGPQLFQIVPLFGGMVAWVWQLVLTVIGVKVVHTTSYGRSAVAVLLPMLLCCGFFLLIAMVVAGWIFAAALTAAG